MCFCASGSFAASGALAIAGALTLSIAQREERLIAAIPLIFALQQAVEGLQWLMPHPSTNSLALGYGFLVFAFLFWPVYLPLATYRIEPDPRRRHILRWFIGIGVLTSLALLWNLLARPLQVLIHPLGILYLIDSPFGWLGALWYLIATCGSLLVSSRRSLRWFGMAGVISAISTAFIFQQTFVSVWCFFGAVLSVFVYFIVARKRPHKK